MEEIMKDERFSHILNDPRFRKMPKGVQRVTVDKRFKGMFKDNKFKEKCLVDKRGRPTNLMPTENLKNLYSISSESSDSEDDNQLSLDSETEVNITRHNRNKEFQQSNKNSLKSEKNQKLLKKRFSEKKYGENSSLVKKDKKLVTSEDQKQDDVESNGNEEDCFPDSENEVAYDENESSEILEKSNKKQKEAIKGGKLQNKKVSNHNEKTTDNTSAVENTKKDFYKTKQITKVKNRKQSSADSVSENRINDSISNNDISSKILDSKDFLSTKNKAKNSICTEGTSESENDDVDDDLEVLNEKSSSEDYEESSEESDSSESEDSTINKEDFDHHWEELRNEAPDTEQITKRLAVCNMDWDRIRAEDLYAAFASFKPPDGCIYSVKIYPSEFGLKRMEEEKLHGPSELIEEALDPEAEEEEGDVKGSKYHREKLRQYQINRLRYYYAVIDCDSPETANTLYEQLNGMEYESSSIRLDIRFIPDDTTFDHEPASVADKAPDPTEYKPRLFVTSALQQVKVNLTWDETDPKRRETLQKAFTEPQSIENDIRNYLASSSSESEVAEENEDEDAPNECKPTTKDRIAKYRALLQSLEKKEKEEENKYEMEITWEPGLKEKTEEIVKEKVQAQSLNPFEELLKKKKEGKKLKKNKKAMNSKISESSSSEDSDSNYDSGSSTQRVKEKTDSKKLAQLSLMSDSNKCDFFDKSSNRKSKSKKWKKGKNGNEKSNAGKLDSFKCDVNDPRFSAIYSSHLFNIDPSNPHFKKTEGNLALIQAKQKRLKNRELDLNQEKNVKKKKYF